MKRMEKKSMTNNVAVVKFIKHKRFNWRKQKSGVYEYPKRYRFRISEGMEQQIKVGQIFYILNKNWRKVPVQIEFLLALSAKQAKKYKLLKPEV